MDISSPASPPKGKGSASSHKTWRTNWCDFYPILERPRRPLVWSQSSVIWTAHPTQPLIIGRHFASSKQFHLPSPTPVLSSPVSFEPPTVISVSSSDDWLFAFYPRKDGEGIGCMWNRGSQIDNWQVKEWWNFSKSGGAVSATWLAGTREWASTLSGTPTRLPFRGPTTPASNPTLVVVTEDNNLFVFYYRYIITGLRSIKRSLIIPGVTVESSQSFNATDGLENANGTKYCVHAAISMGYNESSIFIATHSRRMPVSPITGDPSSEPSSFSSMSLGVPMDLFDPIHRDTRANDFETWGEEYTVEVLEAQLRFDGTVMSLILQPFGTLDIGHASLVNISFLSRPPPQSNIGDPAARKPPERGHTYLAVSCANFHGYTSPPTSNLKLYSLVQKAASMGRGPLSVRKVLNQEASLAIGNGVIIQTESFVDFTSPTNILMQAYILHHSGSLPTGGSGLKDLIIGTLKVLNIPDLSDNTKFEPAVINAARDSAGHDLPLFAATSPNHSLLCALSTSLWKTQLSIYALPKPKPSDPNSPPPLSSKVAVAILARKSTEDLIHCVSSPQIPVSEATDIIYYALNILETLKPELPYAATWDVMGVATEVYRTRASSSKDGNEKELLEDRWQTAHDLCSVAACNIAFEDCKEEGGYDLEAAWQLITLSTWVVTFSEKLMKSAVICNNSGMGPTDPSLYASDLFHLAHPFALQNLIVALKHINALRSYIGSLPAGGDNPQMAQLVLVDTVDSCGINFGCLITLLEENLPTVKTFDPKVCQRALAACQPMGAMLPYLTKLVNHICDSDKLLNKTTLFMKPTDLVDGMAWLSTEKRKIDGNDVITKRVLPAEGPWDECLRCGGKTTISKNAGKVVGLAAPRWVMWERKWEIRCLCGGPWSTRSASNDV